MSLCATHQDWLANEQDRLATLQLQHGRPQGPWGEQAAHGIICTHKQTDGGGGKGETDGACDGDGPWGANHSMLHVRVAAC